MGWKLKNENLKIMNEKLNFHDNELFHNILNDIFDLSEVVVAYFVIKLLV